MGRTQKCSTLLLLVVGCWLLSSVCTTEAAIPGIRRKRVLLPTFPGVIRRPRKIALNIAEDPLDPTQCEFNADGSRRANRVRKSWSEMTKAEKDLYLQAFSDFNAAGLHNLFVGLHVYGPNTAQAHGTSSFFPWHRVYLLAFENTLRILNPAYKCLTVPYWNWAAETTACTQNRCGSLLNAHPILSETGGSGSQSTSTTTLGDSSTRFSGFCSDGAKSRPYGRNTVFTMDGRSMGSNNCLIRGDYGRSATAPTLSDLRSAVINTPSYGNQNSGYRLTFETSLHGRPHVLTGGIMGNMCSPGDIIFFSHHAFVDKMFSVWTSYYGYKSISQRNAYATTGIEADGPNDIFIFYIPVDGVNVPAWEYNPTLRKAWPYSGSGVPIKTAAEVYSSANIGRYSFTYSADRMDIELLSGPSSPVSVMMMEVDRIGRFTNDEASSSGNDVSAVRQDMFGQHFTITRPHLQTFVERIQDDQSRVTESVLVEEAEALTIAEMDTDEAMKQLLEAYKSVKAVVCEKLKQPDWQEVLTRYGLQTMASKACEGIDVERFVWSELKNEECWAKYNPIVDGKLQPLPCDLLLEDFQKFMMMPENLDKVSTNPCCDVIERIKSGVLKLLQHDQNSPSTTLLLLEQAKQAQTVSQTQKEADESLKSRLVQMLEQKQVTYSSANETDIALFLSKSMLRSSKAASDDNESAKSLPSSSDTLFDDDDDLVTIIDAGNGESDNDDAENDDDDDDDGTINDDVDSDDDDDTSAGESNDSWRGPGSSTKVSRTAITMLHGLPVERIVLAKSRP